jgi:hypothetical protein
MKCRNREHDCDGDSTGWGHGMAIGDYVAAAVLIMLVLRGVAGILAQDKFRL